MRRGKRKGRNILKSRPWLLIAIIKGHKISRSRGEKAEQMTELPCIKESRGMYKTVKINEKNNKSRRVYGDIEEIEDIVETKFRLFGNFDVLQLPPKDHKFITGRKILKLFDENTTQSGRFESELEGLDAGLPSSIFVRTYQSNMDLFRAAIIGPHGTPYCHGLFFFDIFFPSNYPEKPPEVFYHSHSLDLITDMHHRGKVDLKTLINRSRLNGDKVKMWDDKESNILQVLVSIQNFLLLNQTCKPKKLETEESVFQLTCEAILRTLRDPPENFEDFVAGHFRTRAHSILMKYKEYKNAEKTTDKLFFRLIRAFEANGTYCQHHYTKHDMTRL